ncbi:cohesin domain-containing protein [Natrialba sp. INN-245]|uniref:cohesin domain-containing protein n=1 Tax=Natrialba sp. INN-245 TaxID=2690967 RepID=UPI0013130C87|nr:cohesin domain-containing protein [Natrialba sp. INN-245]MWV38228.1 cohesin domain-containing protein [Natrialba sp. INN-245]
MSRAGVLEGRSSRARAGVTIGVVCLLGIGLLVPAPVFAGDNTTLFFFEETEIDADPGETIELELVVSDHGDYNANGIDELGFELSYDPDVFTVTELEHGSMLTAGDSDVEVVGTSEIDGDTGTIIVEQERDPSGDGARATETAVTITLEVAEDAEPTTETIEISDAFATLVTDYPQAVIERDATVSVDGGAGPADDESAGTDGPDGVTFADEETSDAPSDSSADDAGTGTVADPGEGSSDESADDAATEDSIPGFVGAAAVLSIAVALMLRHTGNRR